MRTHLLAGFVIVTLCLATVEAQDRPQLTAETLANLKASSNDPGGDFFIDTPEKLGALIDAFAADTSMVSPMYLLMASNTALRLKRVEDAAFLFYAAQIRARFDFDRYEISARPDGNNAATYLGFLMQTTGQGVNPAIQRQPRQFTSVIQRIESWEVVPSANAFYPEFKEAKGFKVSWEQWPALAQSIKSEFLERFGRRYARLLNDPEYFKAFQVVQDANFSAKEPDDATLKRVEAATKTMEDIEARLFPGPDSRQQLRNRQEQEPAAAAAADSVAQETPPARWTADEMPLRVGGNVPAPKKIKHVEPVFSKGRRGSVVIEVTIGRDGRVEKLNVVSGDFGLFEAADAAIRQWVFEPVIVDGKPVSVLQTFSFSAK
jgi:TonB family protein